MSSKSTEEMRGLASIAKKVACFCWFICLKNGFGLLLSFGARACRREKGRVWRATIHQRAFRASASHSHNPIQGPPLVDNRANLGLSLLRFLLRFAFSFLFFPVFHTPSSSVCRSPSTCARHRFGRARGVASLEFAIGRGAWPMTSTRLATFFFSPLASLSPHFYRHPLPRTPWRSFTLATEFTGFFFYRVYRVFEGCKWISLRFPESVPCVAQLSIDWLDFDRIYTSLNLFSTYLTFLPNYCSIINRFISGFHRISAI